MTKSTQSTPCWASSAVLIVGILSLGVFMSGCATVIKGAPNRPAYESAVIRTLVQKYSRPNAITIDSVNLTEDLRNRTMEDLIFLIDGNYHQFENELYRGRALFDTATDLAIIGLGAAGALVAVTGTQAILAAISGGIGGARVSINKNFFREQSTNALISTMRASRKAKLKLMRDAQLLSVKDYPMSRALVDIAEYYNSGTIIGAFESIISEAGQKEQTSANAIENKVQAQVQEGVDLKFRTGRLQERIRNWLLKDPANYKSFNTWLKDKRVTLEAASWVYNTETKEEDLLDAILYFNIPELERHNENEN